MAENTVENDGNAIGFRLFAKRFANSGLKCFQNTCIGAEIFITLNTPKPLIRVNGVRIIDTLIDGAMAAGIEEIIVVCGYLGEQFVQLKEKKRSTLSSLKYKKEDKWTFLYDIKNDPWETENLAQREEYKEKIKEMRERIIKHSESWEEKLHPWGADFSLWF